MARQATVIGAGIFGLACAWELIRRGAEVHVIDAATPGAGSSGGTVGALAPHAPDNWNPKKQMQLDALIAAEGWWADIAGVGGVDPGYGRTGRIQPAAQPERERIEARIKAAAAHWSDGFRMWLTDQPPAQAILPESADGLYLIDNLTARLSPRAACRALAAAIRAAGGTITEMAGAQHPDSCGATAGPVIWATGAPGLTALSDDLGRLAGNGVKGQSALLALSCPDAAQVFADGVHIVPHADGTVAIGSTSEREFSDPRATDGQLDALIERARAICLGLAGAPVVERWAGVRPRAASRAPLLGAWPGRPGHYVANGGFKIGFGMAPVAADLMAGLILTGTDAIPAEFRLR